MNDLPAHQPPVFTLGEAAKAAGVSKPTLSKAISSGRLSAEKREDGSYQIQAGELFRVYPPSSKGNQEEGAGVSEREAGKADPLLESEIARLREQLASQTEERDRERRQLTDQIDDLRKRLDLEGEERRKLTAILTDQSAKSAEAEAAAAPAAPPTPAPRGLFGWLKGRG